MFTLFLAPALHGMTRFWCFKTFVWFIPFNIGVCLSIDPQINSADWFPSVKIGRPGYRVTKQFDQETRQRSLLFQIEYPEIEEGTKPRHRFMSSYEQRVQAWDKRYQYLLFAAEPYEIIAFKVIDADFHFMRIPFFQSLYIFLLRLNFVRVGFK